MTLKFETDLNCGGCVAAVTPSLDREETIEHWSVDTADPRKTLTVEGDTISAETVERLVAEAGFHVLREVHDAMPTHDHHAAHDQHDHEAVETKSFWATYRPLLLVVGYLVGVVFVVDAGMGFNWMRAMGHFMGGFFLAFSFFKLLDLAGFADAFQSYDVLAKRSWVYGYAYPFIELALGVAYLIGFQPVFTNSATLAVMLLGLIGVSQALLQKRRIQCACLGTVFNLPMSTVTFIEDGVMAVMALAMLFGISRH